MAKPMEKDINDVGRVSVRFAYLRFAFVLPLVPDATFDSASNGAIFRHKSVAS